MGQWIDMVGGTENRYLIERRRQHAMLAGVAVILAGASLPAQNTRGLMSGLPDAALEAPKAFAAIAPAEVSEASRFIRPPVGVFQTVAKRRISPTARAALAPALGGPLGEEAGPAIAAPALATVDPAPEEVPGATDIPGLVTEEPELAFAQPPRPETVVSLEDEPQAGGVPEPSTWMMMLLGFGLLGWLQRRKPVKTQTSAGFLTAA